MQKLLIISYFIISYNNEIREQFLGFLPAPAPFIKVNRLRLSLKMLGSWLPALALNTVKYITDLKKSKLIDVLLILPIYSFTYLLGEDSSTGLVISQIIKKVSSSTSYKTKSEAATP